MPTKPLLGVKILPKWAVRRAKEIISNWGYEEEGWWRPIAEELDKAHKAGQTELAQKVETELIGEDESENHMGVDRRSKRSYEEAEYNRARNLLRAEQRLKLAQLLEKGGVK